jgi:type IV pilus assembly protein PilO
MTFSSDLIESDLVANDTSFIAAPTYPSVFGITFSPAVIGGCLAVVGMGVAGYLYYSFLQPQLAKNQELETKLADTQKQIDIRKDNDKKIAEAEKNLDRANTQRQIVTSLFANDKKLDTLLLDLNKLVNIRQGQLESFMPDAASATDPTGAVVVSDSSLGTPLNNKIKRKGVTVKVNGNFEQVQSILRTIERLDQLLIVKDLKVDGDKQQKILVDAQGKILAQPEAKLAATFKIQALIPLTAAEQAAATPPAPAAKK